MSASKGVLFAKTTDADHDLLVGRVDWSIRSGKMICDMFAVSSSMQKAWELDVRREREVWRTERPLYGKQKESLARILDTEIPKAPGAWFKVASIKWEAPVLSSNGFILGFLDLLATGELRRPQYHLVSFPDEIKEFTSSQVYKQIAVECKTAVDSIGPLLRQIQAYRTRCEADFVAVIPSTAYEQYASVLSRNGIWAFTPDDLGDNE